jgi:hypothetical protein
MGTGGNIIQQLDLMDIIFFVGKKSRRFQAVLLQDIEEVLGKDTEEYTKVRKLVLDSFNNYTRSVLRTIFGNDFEL